MKSLLLVLTLGLAVPGAAPVQFTTLAEGQTSGFEEYREVVVRTPLELIRFWKQHAPGQRVPTLEFAKSMVVGVILGTRNTGGYRAVVTGIDRTGADVVVTWREDEPKPGLILTQALTSPFHLVTVEQASGAVKFTKAAR
jgi:PrcB C-terminal